MGAPGALPVASPGALTFLNRPNPLNGQVCDPRAADVNYGGTVPDDVCSPEALAGAMEYQLSETVNQNVSRAQLVSGGANLSRSGVVAQPFTPASMVYTPVLNSQW